MVLSTFNKTLDTLPDRTLDKTLDKNIVFIKVFNTFATC